MLNRIKILNAALAVFAFVGLKASTQVMADTVNLDTYAGNGWTVTRDATTSDVLNVTSIPGAWVDPSSVNSTQNAIDNGNHAAQWVSQEADGGGGSDSNGQLYTYKDTFTLASFSGPGTISLSGTISTDNWIPTGSSPIPGVDGVTLTFGGNTYDVQLTDPSLSGELGQESMYHYSFNINLDPTLFISPEQFVLAVKVVNSFEDPSNGQNPGPTGLILAGTATATSLQSNSNGFVPVPASALSGTVLLAGLGIYQKIRRRHQI